MSGSISGLTGAKLAPATSLARFGYSPAMHIQDLRQRLMGHGALPVHTQRLLRHWTRVLPWTDGRPALEHFLPLPLRQALPAVLADLEALATLREQHPSDDGSQRLLVGLHDGQTVETVLLPRGGLCVSTQVGCAVGCVFCMTGRGGLLRQLGSAEIVAQVVLARHVQPVKKVVFMGMGEPAHNLEAVLEAIDLLGNEGAIGHKDLVFSTVGDARVFARLPQAQVDKLMDDAERGANARIAIDLEKQEIRGPDGGCISFEVDSFRKQCLLNGWDDIGLTLRDAEGIATFEKRHLAQAPWL